MREFPPQHAMLRPRDRAPLRVVPAQTWHCLYCEPDGGEGAGTTVDWLGSDVEGPDGRCRECGQVYVLARPFERVPDLREE